MHKSSIVKTLNSVFVIVMTDSMYNAHDGKEAGIETMVFRCDAFGNISRKSYGNPVDEAWFPTEKDAEQGHDGMCDKWMDMVLT